LIYLLRIIERRKWVIPAKRKGGCAVATDQSSKSPIENIADAESIEADRARREDVRQKVKVAREILSDKTLPESILETHNERFGREAHFVITIFSLVVGALLLTWYLWEDSYLQNEEDLVYNLGLIGGIMMLLQFIYSARKRSAKMRRWGNLKLWFGLHTVIGISAPAIIVIHSRFELASINGTVAFIAMLVVVFSGIIGRYLYSQVNFDLSNSRIKLTRLHKDMHANVIRPNAGLASDIEKHLKGFMIAAFATPGNIIQAAMVAASVDLRAKYIYFQLCQLKVPQATTGQSGVSQNVNLFGHEEKKILKEYLGVLSKMAHYNAYKQLFALWRIGHVPFIYLLLATGLAHVLAVHMY